MKSQYSANFSCIVKQGLELFQTISLFVTDTIFQQYSKMVQRNSLCHHVSFLHSLCHHVSSCFMNNYPVIKPVQVWDENSPHDSNGPWDNSTTPHVGSLSNTAKELRDVTKSTVRSLLSKSTVTCIGTWLKCKAITALSTTIPYWNVVLHKLQQDTLLSLRQKTIRYTIKII